MSRYSPGHAYGQEIEADSYGDYLISWTVDYYYRGSRLRWPRRFSRWTDEKGAKRFCKKWGLELPAQEAEESSDA